MARTSDFVHPADVLDPELRPRPTDTVDFDGTACTRRGTAVTLVCIVAVLMLAALQPHARNVRPAEHSDARPPVAATLR